jgi:ABC-type multidrug transport system fused ATPase/permease subunit
LKKVDAVKKPAKRSKADEKKSLNKVLDYGKREIGALSLGMVYLWLACVSDFVVPLYIGFVIDVLEKGEFHKVGPLCWQLFIIIIVSLTNALTQDIDFRSVWGFESNPFQHYVRENRSELEERRLRKHHEQGHWLL